MTRYIPNTDTDRQAMLAAIGVHSLDALFVDIPPKIRVKELHGLPGPLSEMALTAHLRQLAEQNIHCSAGSGNRSPNASGGGQAVCFLGAGAYDHFIPAAIDQLILRQEFYTAYTPYQPEISQGTLQAIFEYQSMICMLTGMEAGNASMYDGATAMAEAAVMACQAASAASRTGKRMHVAVSRAVHPQWRAVLHTYASCNGMEVREIAYDTDGGTSPLAIEKALGDDVGAVILQSPNFFGVVEDIRAAAELAHQAQALLVTCVDPFSLGILEAPGVQGADIAVGEGQSLGLPLNYGGPYLGFIACKEKLMRRLPGRIAGETVDHDGRRGFVLTLQTREQHIRREKATSNICTNHALNALAATMYLSLMGRDGLKEAAELCTRNAHDCYRKLTEDAGFEKVFEKGPFFKEFVVALPKNVEKRSIKEINEALLAEGILGGYALERDYPELKSCMLVAVTEKRTVQEIDDFVRKVVRVL